MQRTEYRSNYQRELFKKNLSRGTANLAVHLIEALDSQGRIKKEAQWQLTLNHIQLERILAQVNRVIDGGQKFLELHIAGGTEAKWMFFQGANLLIGIPPSQSLGGDFSRVGTLEIRTNLTDFRKEINDILDRMTPELGILEYAPGAVKRVQAVAGGAA